MFMSDRFRVYTNTDVVGSELGGAVKNALAIAAGMGRHRVRLEYQGRTDHRALAELARLGVALGGSPLTFLGLAGNGDLIATCSSPQSRNRHVGEQLGRGRSLAEILGEMDMVAEGVGTAPAVLELAAGAGVEMPITEQVARVLRGERSPQDALSTLMHARRRRKPTTWRSEPPAVIPTPRPAAPAGMRSPRLRAATPIGNTRTRPSRRAKSAARMASGSPGHTGHIPAATFDTTPGASAPRGGTWSCSQLR